MDIEKNIEFIIAQQAQFHANLEAQRERFEAADQKLGARIDQMTAAQEGQQQQINSIIILVGRQFEVGKAQDERLDRLSVKLDALGEKVDKLHEDVTQLHEDVTLLFKIADDLIRRNNGGHAKG